MRQLFLPLVTLIALAIHLEGCVFGCGGAPANKAELSVYVTDGSTGRPVASPRFEMNGTGIDWRCMEPDRMDPNLCTSVLLFVDRGKHEITVSATGYTESMFEVDTGTLDSVHVGVTLNPAK